MAILTWTEFEPLVAMRLPEIPVPVLEDEARRAAITFYQDTRTWRDAAPATKFTSVAETALYTITPPTQGELCGVCEAWFNTRRIVEWRNTEQGHEQIGNDGSPPVSGTPLAIIAASRTQVRLIPTPNIAAVLVASYAYRPTPASTGIDEELFREHYDAIAALIVATCGMHAKKPWSNPGAAQTAQREYDRLALQYASRAGSRGQRLRTRAQGI